MVSIRRRRWSTGKKSVSAGGNSKQWRFKVKDLVRRSHSKGSKSRIVLLTDETKAITETPAGGCVIPAPQPRGAIGMAARSGRYCGVHTCRTGRIWWGSSIT
ncbi:S-adenosyl-L-methionine-dependentmethyltransferases superfamily protein [Striga asiatica]|uniref:S-adenosyl-L-methionine-dependentmethyltransferases superfamily protein n=1 Tax=Striga asiatica TaxID=4170 RepID=A0A5A7RMT6_STRAF|nr:S-adenosyl-L-methionine-dependentmethyltransferases superfamily protein [Striga asiatica]